MELADYNIMFVHIKGQHNVLSDAISRLKMLDIYKEPLENAKAQVINNTKQDVMEIYVTSIHIISIHMLHNEQKWDKTCKKLASQICCGTKTVLSWLLCLQVVFYISNNLFMVCSMT